MAVTWPELLQEPIVWREPLSGVRRTVEAALARAGLGIGFASAEALDRVRWPLASLRLNPPGGLIWTLYLILPQVPFQSLAVRAFLELIGQDPDAAKTP